MKTIRETAKVLKLTVVVIVGLVLLAKVQVHANVGGASCSASVLALVAGVVGLLVLLGLAVVAYVVVREVRPGIYRPKHA